MAKPRVIVKRRKSVRNIRKITRTMQLIATARFQAAMNRAVATRPYTERLAELVASISRAMQGEVAHPLMKARDGAKRDALMVITSNRGLCGGYNTSVLRRAMAHLADRPECDVYMVGKKGINYFRFLNREMVDRIGHIGDTPRFNQVEPYANTFMDRFTGGRLGTVHVCYMRFFSASRQSPDVIQLLPLTQGPSAGRAPGLEPAAEGPARTADVPYEFSPNPKELLEELLPATVRIRLFQCFTDAAVSEQVARMVAMKAATDAAGDMITALTRQYNRARQSQITMELLDIVGGANALA
jgi:F-type H+-transporting ATPase subunit gamma